MLLVLMAASVLVFVIACSNVANLILARTVRREGELGIRAALGASTVALRRALLAESLLLCVGGATIGVSWRARWFPFWHATPRAFRCARSILRLTRACFWSERRWLCWPRCYWRSFRACRRREVRRDSAWRAAAFVPRAAPIAGCGSSRWYRSPRHSCCWPEPARW